MVRWRTSCTLSIPPTSLRPLSKLARALKAFPLFCAGGGARGRDRPPTRSTAPVHLRASWRACVVTELSKRCAADWSGYTANQRASAWGLARARVGVRRPRPFSWRPRTLHSEESTHPGHPGPRTFARVCARSAEDALGSGSALPPRSTSVHASLLPRAVVCGSDRTTRRTRPCTRRDLHVTRLALGGRPWPCALAAAGPARWTLPRGECAHEARKEKKRDRSAVSFINHAHNSHSRRGAPLDTRKLEPTAPTR